ncbi:MAG: hypothetical protein NC911_06730 [Candidatus Omnitrophica bacterium]|nr:hypothetical protein [Candidatus Omnitrophota bacterium]
MTSFTSFAKDKGEKRIPCLYFLVFSFSCFPSEDTYLRNTVVFHLDFENGLLATQSAGENQPTAIRLNNQLVSPETIRQNFFTFWLTDKGLTNRESTPFLSVGYPVEKNLPPGGTIVWWLKYEKLHPSASNRLIFQTQAGKLFVTLGQYGRVWTHGNVPVYQSDLTGVFLPRNQNEWTQLGFRYGRPSLHFILNGRRIATETWRQPFQLQDFSRLFNFSLSSYQGEK